MAPTLTANSFIPKTITTQRTKTNTTSQSRKNLVFFSVSANQASSDKPQNPKPFQFDFTKLPDVKSLVPAIANPSTGLSFGNQRRKDVGTVFVAGAMGQVGARIAQALLRSGFAVRAGVVDLDSAQELARIAATYKIISNEESKRLNAVDSALRDPESIAKSIGNASKVVVTVGPEENGTGPNSKVSTSDALQVIRAAKLANVDHVAIVYADSAPNASTYNVLDGFKQFFDGLFSKSQPPTLPEFLQKVVEADVSYTLIKTNLTEDYGPEASYNLVVAAEGSAGANDYKVTKSQIASLVADVFSDTAIAENKVVEVSTDPSAPLKSISELLSAIPEDGRRKAYAEALAKAEAEEEALRATEKAREAGEAAKKLEEEVKKLKEEEALASSVAAEAEKKAEATIETIIGRARGVSSQISWEKLSSQLKTAIEGAAAQQRDEEEPKVRVATVRGQAKARSLPSLKAVVKNPATEAAKKPAAKAKEAQRKKKAADAEESSKGPETRKLFGGLFQQETIYVDED